MKPAAQDPVAASPAASHRRGVRLFVAAHGAAVAAIYAVALVMGGGFAGPPMPAMDITVALGAPVQLVAEPGPTSAKAQPGETPPGWTQPAELAAPWDSR